MSHQKKYLVAFRSYGKWVSSRPLRDLVNSRWNSGIEARHFQPFKFPSNGRPLLLTSQEREFRFDKGLRRKCGNHKINNETACTLHPPYGDVRLDNRGILDVDPQKITAAAKVPALSSFVFFLSRLDSITTKLLTHSTMQLPSSFSYGQRKK